LATAAHQSAWSSFVESWRRQEGPSHRLLQRSLSAWGYRNLPSTSLEQKLFSTLPQSEDMVGFWLSENHSWVLVLSAHSEGTPLALCHTSACGAAPPTLLWKNLGLGWEGFQSLVHTLDKSRPVSRIRSPEKPDARAIIF
jgi:hypothetical protein